MEKFLARQPIFNSERDVYGYELLFRSGPGNFFDGSHPEAAAASAVDSMFLFGIDRLTHGRRAFINCTRDFLLRDFPATLPTDRVVLEVLETVQPDDEIVAACRRLKNMGYLIALDDFQESPAWLPLTELAAFIKVDVLLSSELEQQRLSKAFAKKHLRLVAEKVESYDDFQRTLGWGYSFFQGYFFSRPEMLTRHDIPSNKLNYLRVLQAVNQKEMNLHAVSDCIKSEASLGYRLLRYLNSPAFPLIAEVHSIPHALSLLGERGVRRWVSLVAIACMGDNKPEELIMLPLIRAHFCESLAPLAGLRSSANDLFLLGLLSAVDAILDMKMQDVVHEIAIGDEIRGALLGEQNKLRDIFDLALKYEMGCWDALAADARRLRIPENAIPELYVNQSNGPEASCPPLETVATLRNFAGINQSAAVGAGLRSARVQPVAATDLIRGSESDPPQVAQACPLWRALLFILRTFLRFHRALTKAFRLQWHRHSCLCAFLRTPDKPNRVP